MSQQESKQIAWRRESAERWLVLARVGIGLGATNAIVAIVVAYWLGTWVPLLGLGFLVVYITGVPDCYSRRTRMLAEIARLERGEDV